MIKKLETGKYLVDIYPNGRAGKRVRKQFDKKHQAIAFENWVIAEYSQKEPYQLVAETDKRHLSELIELWYSLHGKSLSDSKSIHRKLVVTCEGLGDPVASKFTAKQFSDYRSTRLDNVKAATVNRELAYLRAMFNELEALGHWKLANPIAKVRALKEAQTELTYYNIDELNELFRHLKESSNPHVYLVAKTCLAIGARWTEAESLTPSQIKDGRIQLNKTKSGKRRIVPITAEFQQELQNHKRYSQNQLFNQSLWAFRQALKKSGLRSPPGQLTHVLRHSFAVGFMEKGGNLVDLMNTLGHSTIQTTSIYLRFAPTHLLSVPKLTPANGLIF